MVVEQRRKILAKLKKYLNVTVCKGASEQEAMIAAQRAAALMREHDLAYSSVEEIEAEEFHMVSRPWFRGRGNRKRSGRVPPTRYCLVGIDRLCAVRHAWTAETGHLFFFGTESNVEIAFYILDLVSGAIDREYADYSGRTGITGVAASTSFKKAMAIRVGMRLEDMARSNMAGTGLIPVRDAIVAERFAEAFNTSKSAGSGVVTDDKAAKAGAAAAERVSINRAVRGPKGAQRKIVER